MTSFLFLSNNNSFRSSSSTDMGVNSSPKIQPASGIPFVDCKGVIEMMGLLTCLDDFLGLTTEVGSLGGSEISASCFRPPVFSFSSWCSSLSGAESLEPSASICYTYMVVGFSPSNTGGRQLRLCSCNLKKSALSS
jgi:hypothetical protein